MSVSQQHCRPHQQQTRLQLNLMWSSRCASVMVVLISSVCGAYSGGRTGCDLMEVSLLSCIHSTSNTAYSCCHAWRKIGG